MIPPAAALKWIDAEFTKRELRRFQPYYPWKVGLTDTKPIDAGAKRALDIFTGNPAEDDCWTLFGTPFAQLFCYFNANLASYVPAYRARDYVGEIFAYNTTAASLWRQFGLLGFADDNWVDGTQTHVFMFDTPEYRELGFGFTSTAVHEFGHHLGMSHPHDGYDSELGLDFGPGGELGVCLGRRREPHRDAVPRADESSSDSSTRTTRTAGRRRATSTGRMQSRATSSRTPRPIRAAWLLWFADAAAAEALDSFKKWEYQKAAASARLAYQLVLTAAEIHWRRNDDAQCCPARAPEPTVCARRLPDSIHVSVIRGLLGSGLWALGGSGLRVWATRTAQHPVGFGPHRSARCCARTTAEHSLVRMAGG